MERNIRKVTINAHLRSFQYKILNNIPYLNKKTTYLWSIKHTPMFFYKMEVEASHLFHYYTHIQDIWNKILAHFTGCLYFSQLTPDCHFWLT